MTILGYQKYLFYIRLYLRLLNIFSRSSMPQYVVIDYASIIAEKVKVLKSDRWTETLERYL